MPPNWIYLNFFRCFSRVFIKTKCVTFVSTFILSLCILTPKLFEIVALLEKEIPIVATFFTIKIFVHYLTFFRFKFSFDFSMFLFFRRRNITFLFVFGRMERDGDSYNFFNIRYFWVT